MAAPGLTVADATKRQDGHDLLNFNCWNGDPEEPFAAEAEDYIRRLALGSTYKTLTFRASDGTLAAVSAFDRRDVQPYLAARFLVPGWHLQVIGVALPFRSSLVACALPPCPSEVKISEYVFRRTYARMLEADPKRNVVTAMIHGDNARSIEACRRVQLERTVREDETYWRMMGSVDPHVGCPPNVG